LDLATVARFELLRALSENLAVRITKHGDFRIRKSLESGDVIFSASVYA
jgi:hypothetical protein